MSWYQLITPARSALNPVLSDDPVIDLEHAAVRVFYTPGAQRIANHIGFIIAVGSGMSLLIAWILSVSGGPKPLEGLFTLLAFSIAGIPALESVWGKLRTFTIDIDLLMLLGAGLAAYVGSPFEGALLLFLFALSGGLEAYALGRTQRAIVALRDLAPKVATVIEDGSLVRVSLRQVRVGACVLVRPGEKVPVDGTVLRGSSSVDESAITGESIPRDCGEGDTVLAGTQNVNGRLEVRVTKLAADTTLARIVELVTSARHHPARAQRLIDRIGPTYSIVVILAAVLVGVVAAVVFDLPGREAVHRGIAVLIVASPCALIIATPVAYLASVAAAARNGVLIKGGAHLESVARAVVVVFDKTGTLTTGRVRLTDVIPLGGADERGALRMAGAIEGSSNHPLAAAITRAVNEWGLTVPAVSQYESMPGEGARGVVDGRSVWVGRPERAHESAPGVQEDLRAHAERLRGEGKTVSAMTVDGSAVVFAFEDAPRERARDCVRQLRAQGITRIEMLTGDHNIVARGMAERIELDGYKAELLPQEKLEAVEQLRARFGSVVVVGDGINDAPALASADVGIAMGGGGADVAMEAADIILMNDRIENVAWLHRHARRTARIVAQNLCFAIGVITVLSVFAAMGSIPLPLAVIGHEGSTVLVALNALRLLRG